MLQEIAARKYSVFENLCILYSVHIIFVLQHFLTNDSNIPSTNKIGVLSQSMRWTRI